MSIDWRPAQDLIEKHQRLLLTTHVNPEPDAIGSEVALREVLQGLGKEVVVWNSSPTPLNCVFLDPSATIRPWKGPDPSVMEWAELIVILDVNAWSRLGEVGAEIHESSRPRLLIDHHQGGDPDIAETRVSDTSAAATGILIFELMEALGAPLDATIASALYAALIVDTGGFRFANTDPRALRTAAALVSAGARPDAVFRSVFEETSWARLRLLPLALGSLRSDADGRIAWMMITQEMFREAGATEEDCDRFVDQIRGIRGVEVCAVFRERESGEVKGSLRSNGRVDVHAVASRFGGGGHRLASGLTLQGPPGEAVRRVVAAAKEAL